MNSEHQKKRNGTLIACQSNLYIFKTGYTKTPTHKKDMAEIKYCLFAILVYDLFESKN